MPAAVFGKLPVPSVRLKMWKLILMCLIGVKSFGMYVPGCAKTPPVMQGSCRPQEGVNVIGGVT